MPNYSELLSFIDKKMTQYNTRCLQNFEIQINSYCYFFRKSPFFSKIRAFSEKFSVIIPNYSKISQKLYINKTITLKTQEKHRVFSN